MVDTMTVLTEWKQIKTWGLGQFSYAVEIINFKEFVILNNIYELAKLVQSLF